MSDAGFVNTKVKKATILANLHHFIRNKKSSGYKNFTEDQVNREYLDSLPESGNILDRIHVVYEEDLEDAKEKDDGNKKVGKEDEDEDDVEPTGPPDQCGASGLPESMETKPDFLPQAIDSNSNVHEELINMFKNKAMDASDETGYGTAEKPLPYPKMAEKLTEWGDFVFKSKP
jgi:hypothetical protein